MASFKSAVTKRINTIRDTPGTPVWQCNYVEHIIRDETDSRRISEYIVIYPDNDTVGATCRSPSCRSPSYRSITSRSL